MYTSQKVYLNLNLTRTWSQTVEQEIKTLRAVWWWFDGRFETPIQSNIYLISFVVVLFLCYKTWLPIMWLKTKKKPGVPQGAVRIGIKKTFMWQRWNLLNLINLFKTFFFYFFFLCASAANALNSRPSWWPGQDLNSGVLDHKLGHVTSTASQYKT